MAAPRHVGPSRASAEGADVEGAVPGQVRLTVLATVTESVLYDMSAQVNGHPPVPVNFFRIDPADYKAFVEIDEKTDLAVAKEAVRETGGIGGVISPRLLRFGAPAEIEAACRQVLASWLPQGGLFFGPGCTIPWDTPAENIRTLVECASRYGSYA